MGQGKSSVSNSESVTKVETDLICDTCRSDGKKIDAATFCVDCVECLCDDCVEKHNKNEALMTHKFLKKENFSSSITQDLVHELKTIVYCSVHEVQFDYICEDHKKLICHACTRKTHRDCTKISKIQLSPESARVEVKETRNCLKDVRSLRQKHAEISNEIKRQSQERSTILKQIQLFLEQLDKQEENQQTNVLTEERDGELDRLEEYFQTVMELDDHEKTVLISKYVQLSLKSYQKMFPELGDTKDGKEPDLSEICRYSQRLEALKDIVNELVSASYNSSDTTGHTDEREDHDEDDVRPTTEVSQETVTGVDEYAVASSDADTEPCDSLPVGAQIRSPTFSHESTQTESYT